MPIALACIEVNGQDTIAQLAGWRPVVVDGDALRDGCGKRHRTEEKCAEENDVACCASEGWRMHVRPASERCGENTRSFGAPAPS